MELLKKSRAFLLLFVTFFFWGSVYVGGKLISDDVPAPLLGCLRCFVASFPLMLMARKHFGVKIDRADWKYFAGVGVMGYFLTIFLKVDSRICFPSGFVPLHGMRQCKGRLYHATCGRRVF